MDCADATAERDPKHECRPGALETINRNILDLPLASLEGMRKGILHVLEFNFVPNPPQADPKPKSKWVQDYFMLRQYNLWALCGRLSYPILIKQVV